MANEPVFDIRVLERNLQKGLITQKDFDKFLSELDDVEDNAAVVEAEFVEGVLLDNSEE